MDGESGTSTQRERGGFKDLLVAVLLTHPDVRKAIETCTSNHERMSLVRELEGIDLLFNKSRIPIAKKSSVVSESKRKEGNKLFQSGQYGKARSAYTESLAYADPSHEDAGGKNNEALAFSNRSAALFYLQKYEDCLGDIEEAIKAKYPEDLQHKLYARKGKCYYALNYAKQGKIAFELAKALLDKTDLDSEKKCQLLKDYDNGIIEGEKKQSVQRGEVFRTGDKTRKPPKLSKAPNAIHTSLSSACRVTYTEAKGRHVIADQDIKPGDVLLVEKPLASVLNLKHNTTHCSYCFKECFAPIPCLQCPIALYCSQVCRELSVQSYHRYECGDLNVETVESIMPGALRPVTTLGLDGVLQRHTRDLTNEAARPTELAGCNDEGKYKAEDYETLQHFALNSERHPVKLMAQMTIAAYFSLKCLEKSDFFSSVSDGEREDVLNIVGSELLGNIQRAKCVVLSICDTERNESDILGSQSRKLGSGLYTTLGLINHSCNPSTYRSFCGINSVARAVKPIKKGEEVSISYSVTYGVVRRRERQQHLGENFYFRCMCIACVNDWPVRSEMEAVRPTFKCDQCHEPLPRTLRGSKPCPACKTIQNLDRKKKVLEASSLSFCKAYSDCQQLRIRESQPAL